MAKGEVVMIGLFDSGSGGLSVLSALTKLAPKADIVYFGDIANAPYGERSQDELAALTRDGIAFLKHSGMTQLVSACNSVSASVLAGAAGEIPFIEMSLPTATHLRQFTGKRFLLIATPATVESGLYQRAIGGTIALDTLPVPHLAGAIEFGSAERDVRDIVRDALLSRKGSEYDGLILGCTHYPLVRNLIEAETEKIFGAIEIIDPAYPVAQAVADSFDIQGTGELRFFISKPSEHFARKVAALIPDREYSIKNLA